MIGRLGLKAEGVCCLALARDVTWVLPILIQRCLLLSANISVVSMFLTVLAKLSDYIQL